MKRPLITYVCMLVVLCGAVFCGAQLLPLSINPSEAIIGASCTCSDIAILECGNEPNQYCGNSAMRCVGDGSNTCYDGGSLRPCGGVDAYKCAHSSWAHQSCQ